MRRNKTMIFVLVAIFLVLGVSIAQARIGASRIGTIVTQSSGLLRDGHGHVTTDPALVYSVTVVGDGGVYNGWVQLIDSGGYGAYFAEYHSLIHNRVETAKHKAFIRVDVHAQFTTVNYDPPLYFSEGIFYWTGKGNSDSMLREYRGAEAEIQYESIPQE